MPHGELQSILSRLQHRDPPFQRAPFDLESHLSTLHGEAWAGSVESTLQRIAREQILVLRHVDMESEAWSLDADYMRFVESVGPGTVARSVRIFAPLASSDPSQANLQFHTGRLREKYLAIFQDEQVRQRLLAHSFPLDRLVVFARHAEEPIWFAFGSMMQEVRHRQCVYALHENVEKTPPPMVVTRKGFLGFLKRICQIGTEDEDSEDDEEEDADFMKDVMRHFEHTFEEEESDDESQDEEDKGVYLEFRPFSENHLH